MRTSAEFEDFRFSNPHFWSSLYITFLRGYSPTNTTAIVFSHRDLQPENIMIQHDKNSNYIITGILNWEKSEFYPDCVEITKATSNMLTLDTND